MKKSIIALFFVVILFVGCEKDYEEVVNPSTTFYYVESIREIDSMDFGLGDSILQLQVKAYPTSAIMDINAAIRNPSGNVIRSLVLMDDGNSSNGDTQAGDSLYSNIFKMSGANTSGQYSILYNVNGKLAAIQYFFFENGKEKFPPVISNLIFKDSVFFNEIFTFSVFVVDSNGYDDIKRVYYEAFRPDGSQLVNSTGVSQFPMVDNGDPQAGDITAQDSIFTQKLAFPPGLPTVPPGQYRFEITAEDRSGRFSNKIIHYLEVY